MVGVAVGAGTVGVRGFGVAVGRGVGVKDGVGLGVGVLVTVGVGVDVGFAGVDVGRGAVCVAVAVLVTASAGADASSPAALEDVSSVVLLSPLVAAPAAAPVSTLPFSPAGVDVSSTVGVSVGRAVGVALAVSVGVDVAVAVSVAGATNATGSASPSAPAALDAASPPPCAGVNSALPGVASSPEFNIGPAACTMTHTSPTAAIASARKIKPLPKVRLDGLVLGAVNGPPFVAATGAATDTAIGGVMISVLSLAPLTKTDEGAALGVPPGRCTMTTVMLSGPPPALASRINSVAACCGVCCAIVLRMTGSGTTSVKPSEQRSKVSFGRSCKRLLAAIARFAGNNTLPCRLSTSIMVGSTSTWSSGPRKRLITFLLGWCCAFSMVRYPASMASCAQL